MKKTLLTLLVLCWTISMAAKTIYLNTGGSSLWNQAGAVFYLHSWGSGSDTDKKMDYFYGDIYSAEIPDGDNGIIFLRQKSSSTGIDWDGCWNKTDDLTITGTNNCFTIKAWGQGDGNKVCTGSWSTYTPPAPDPEAPKFYITGDSALVVDAGLSKSKAWNPDAIGSKQETYTLNLKGGVDYKLKITRDGTWNTAKGYTDLTQVAANLVKVDGDDNNIGFRLKSSGPVKVTYTSEVFKLEGSFALPCSEAYGLLIDGQFHACKHNYMQAEWLEFMLRGIKLNKNQTIQLYDSCNNAAWVAGFSASSYTFPVSGDHYVVPEDGTYDFYIKFIYGADEVYIAKHGIYNTAVRDQCTDVMMQAFFNESYRDDAPGVSATENYKLGLGNTKWATLLPQAPEIGKYFDLVWLPPSANGDGMGYHPKEYSNQNSNWGTREELEALIAALHKAGSKVVADIVINHCTGYTSWCDFPTLDFGEYGTFHPDASYICRNDEVNADWNKESAGACWGTASGSYDDGENWDGARDWSHDNVYVQDMFKAYLKWMRNVMKYDGFRYDKGDGFNNWHHDNYNKNAGPYIAFMESYNSTDRILSEIAQANYNLMALDFDLKWHVFNAIAGFNYNANGKGGRGDGIIGRENGKYSKYAVTFIESHDWFLRDDNENEFGGRGKSLTEELKDRLLQANAYLLAMPGVPCVFYPHWKKYKEALKPMIEARKWAGVHSESPVKDESAGENGYQCTLEGKYGWLILQLGNKTTHDNTGEYAWLKDYTLMASGPGYAMWVNRTAPLPTDIEEVESGEPKVERRKILRNGQLFILQGDRMYNAQGQLVK